MKLLMSIIVLLFLFTTPASILADENVTDSAIDTETEVVTESGIVDEEPAEDVQEDEEQSIMAYINENILTTEFFATLSGLGMFVLLGLAKGFLSSNKSFKTQVDKITNFSGDINEIKSQVIDGYGDIKDVLSRFSFMENKINKLEKTEDFLVDVMKDFIRSTNIRVDDKIDLAKKFDIFKSMISHVEKHDLVLSDDIVQEYKEAVMKLSEEDTGKIDEYLENLKSVSNEDDK